nr:MAG TPA: Cytosine specific methyltransferase [Bacteriophage sp.]
MEVVGSIYTGTSDGFQRGIIGGGISRCVKAETHDLGVVMADVNVLGSLEAKFESTNRIYDVGGCSPTLSTMQGGNQEPKILESQIVAMRGRNPDNPSDRTTGSPTEQRLEANTQGTSNCLTSVQKDNMVLVKQATKQGYAECELGGVADLSFPDSDTRRGRVQERGSLCPTIMAQNQELCRIETQYRIRKLTPRECGRLMGVSDEDIDRMAAVNSNTQLYKQFGNSIVVDVMCAMFKNLNIDQGCDLVLKSGDTIKCSDAEEMIKIMNELEKENIHTDFLYEKDGEKGYWLEIL